MPQSWIARSVVDPHRQSRAPVMATHSSVAACLVGEIRALIYPQVLFMLQRNVLKSIQADNFLVYTRAWSQWQIPNPNATGPDRSHYYALYVRAGFDRVPTEVTREQMAALLWALQPVAAEETPDGDVLNHADGSPGWLPVPLQHLANTTLCADASKPDPHDATCLFALRCARCLHLIERAEAKRGARYKWVIRLRPDAFIGCRMRLPDSVIHPLANTTSWAAYAWDYLAFMPRDAAPASLGDGYRASFVKHREALCNRGSTGGTIGCNPCWVRARHQFKLLFLEDHNFGQIDIARQCALKSWETSHSAANSRGRGFATRYGRCHSSVKVLTGPDLVDFEKSDSVCAPIEAVVPNQRRHLKMGFVVANPTCDIAQVAPEAFRTHLAG